MNSLKQQSGFYQKNKYPTTTWQLSSMWQLCWFLLSLWWKYCSTVFTSARYIGTLVLLSLTSLNNLIFYFLVSSMEIDIFWWDAGRSRVQPGEWKRSRRWDLNINLQYGSRGLEETHWKDKTLICKYKNILDLGDEQPSPRTICSWFHQIPAESAATWQGSWDNKEDDWRQWQLFRF